jgi:Domain of unknown function (DUF4372)/Transposase DDE domain
MHSGRIVFSQLLDFIPRYEFNRCIQRYHGNYRVRDFSCLDQFICMAFAQLTYRESLRDIETCLSALQPRLYHCGLRGHVARSTLADANERRDWHIYADFAQVLIRIARKLYAQDHFAVELAQTAYVFDTTTIDLCLKLFPWARFRRHKGAIKLHTLLDLRGSIPCVIHVTEGRRHEINLLDELFLEPGAFYIMDRGFVDFARLATFTESMAYFVIRGKSNLDYRRRSYHIVDHATGLRSDQVIMLCGPKTALAYPYPLRHVSYLDTSSRQRFVFLTNAFQLPALTITQLYRCRWQVELFFKWMKQHLRIKAFYGTSENAVKTQIWIAISVYVLIAVIKKELKIGRSLSEILQILSTVLFENVPISQVLTEISLQNANAGSCNQLKLFHF